MQIMRDFEKKLADLKNEQQRIKEQEEAYKKYEEELSEYYAQQKAIQVADEEVEPTTTSKKRKVVKRRKVKKGVPKKEDIDELALHFSNPQSDEIEQPTNPVVEEDIGWNRANSVATDIPSTKHSEVPTIQKKTTLIRPAPGMQPRAP